MNFIYQIQRKYKKMKSESQNSYTYEPVSGKIETYIIPPELVSIICEKYKDNIEYKFNLFCSDCVNNIYSCNFVGVHNGILKLIDNETCEKLYYDINEDKYVD